MPDPAGTVAICVPEQGDLQVLDTMYQAWTEHGANIARTQFGALRHQVSYRSPGPAPRQDLGTVVAWLRLEDAVSGRRVSVVTDLFKKAVLSRHQDIHGEPPPVLHGHGFRGKGFDLARFLACPMWDSPVPRAHPRARPVASARLHARPAVAGHRGGTLAPSPDGWWCGCGGESVDRRSPSRRCQPRTVDPEKPLLGHGVSGCSRAPCRARPAGSCAVV